MKKSVRFWRGTAIGIFIIFMIGMIAIKGNFPAQDYIARLNVTDMIMVDSLRDKAIAKVKDNDKVKAVIVNIDSPGGTAVGGEALYYSLLELKEKKPVVVTMNNMATSAAYLVATPADRIFAHKGTLTGSIGVILQVPNFGELAKKVGVEMQFVKTSPLKGSPSMFEKMDDNVYAIMKDLVDDFYDVFVDIIVKHRNLNKETVLALADGRVYSGKQALANGLIDEIGTEETAIKWLEENKNIKSGLRVSDIKYGEEKNPIEKLIKTFASESLVPEGLSMQGLVSVWRNAIVN